MRIALLAANVVWFAGLFRLAAEATFGLIAAVAPSAPNDILKYSLLAGTAVVALEAFVFWRWSWYRAMLRQTQNDVRSLWGVPVRVEASTGLPLWPALIAATTLVLPALVVAAVLPGVVAASMAVLIGLGVRVAAAVAAAARDIRAH
jgi:hypothetical protein